MKKKKKTLQTNAFQLVKLYSSASASNAKTNWVKLEILELEILFKNQMIQVLKLIQALIHVTWSNNPFFTVKTIP